MTPENYKLWRDVALTQALEYLIEASSNYLDEISGPQYHPNLTKAEIALRMAIENTIHSLNLDGDIRESIA